MWNKGGFDRTDVEFVIFKFLIGKPVVVGVGARCVSFVAGSNYFLNALSVRK